MSPAAAGAGRRGHRQRQAGRAGGGRRRRAGRGRRRRARRQQVLDALRPMMRQVVLVRDGEGAGRPRRGLRQDRAPPSSAATPRRTRTAGSWATSSAGRRATSPSPSSSRAVSPAAPRSPSPTPSSARSDALQGPPRCEPGGVLLLGQAGEGAGDRRLAGGGPPADRAHLGGAQHADGELAGATARPPGPAPAPTPRATPSSRTTASAAASTADSTGNGSA